MTISTEHNPGKYDDLCTYVRKQAEARGAIVIVLDGNKGFGFSVQCEHDLLVKMPRVLEQMAEQIRKDLAA